MNALRANWWKMLVVVIVGLAIDIVAHELIPESDSMAEKLSNISEALGMIPTIIIADRSANSPMGVPGLIPFPIRQRASWLV